MSIFERGVSESSMGNIYPNPFREEAVISYSIGREARVDIASYNLLGERLTTLVHKQMSQDSYETQWDGTDENGVSLPPGV